MKKHYITPVVKILQINSQVVLNNLSDAIRSNKEGMGYGGVDANGEKDPSAKQRGFSSYPVDEVADDQQVWEKGLW